MQSMLYNFISDAIATPSPCGLNHHTNIICPDKTIVQQLKIRRAYLCRIDQTLELVITAHIAVVLNNICLFTAV